MAAEQEQAAGEAPKGRGSAANEQVKAVVIKGKLAMLRLDPRLMRRPGTEPAERITEAVNAALSDQRAKTPEAEPPADPAAMARRLGEVQKQGMRTMAMITQELGDVMAKLNPGTTGDPGSQGLEGLLGRTRDIAEAVAGDMGSPEDLQGTGTAAHGQVRVVASPNGRVESLDIDTRALRLPVKELAGHVVTAVNAALDDLQAASRTRTGVTRVDPERLRALREESTRQMTAYTGSLSALIDSIQKR